MNNPIQEMYEKMRTKWDTPTVPWEQLDPHRQMMLVQAYNMVIQVMTQ